MDIKRRTPFKHLLRTSNIRAFVKRIQDSPRRWIKSSRSGKIYLAIPIPSRKQLIRACTVGLGILLLIIIIAQLYHYFGPQNYRLSTAEKLLTNPSDILAKDIKYDSMAKAYKFSHGSVNSTETKQTGASLVSATLPVNASKGVTVTDQNYKIDFTMVPQVATAEGKQQQNRIVYPLRNQLGWLVYTALGTGIKEDIVLTKNSGDSYEIAYRLKLPSGTEARKEADGSIGIYGNQIFINNVTAATGADQSLLEKARQNAAKNLLLFTIPKPIVIESGKQTSSVSASFDLSGSRLTVKATGLSKASYPLTIDPSIYIVTAQQFMNGNNETNVDFDVADKLIRKSPTTGARFNAWNSTSALPLTNWAGGTAVAGGYLYSTGGIAQNYQLFTTQGASSFTVPTGVTSITVKLWGGGGGGGAGGSAAAGGAGGGSGEATGSISVTPGESLDIYVGGGGVAGTRNTSGGGGGGGGYSSIYRGSTPLAIAAGGGGGGGGRSTSTHIGGAGGAGGGASGIAGVASLANGGGGAGGSDSGGLAGSGTNPGTAGTALNGGLGANGSTGTTKGSGSAGGLATGGNGGGVTSTTRAGGGGGGAGWFGGGGGAGSGTSAGGGGGGGGSSYGTGLTLNAGSGTTPGNSTDTDRAGAGQGGTAGATNGTGTAGSNGIVVISFNGGGTSPSQTFNWMQFSTTDGTLQSPNPGNGACSGWCTDSTYNLPQARTNFSMVAYNGFLYVIGGQNAAGAPQSTVYIAKLGANGEPQLWSPTSSDKTTWTYWYADTGLSSVRAGMTAVAYNNRMYIIGGRNATTPVNTVEIADITPTGRLSSWTASTNLPYNLYNHGSFVYNDRLYIVGGASAVGGAPLSSVYYTKINNTGTLNSWVQTTSMAGARMSNGGNFTTVWGAYVYVSGGCGAVIGSGKDYCSTVLSDTDVASINADGSIDTWNAIGTLTDQRTGQSLLAWRNAIYQVGGCVTQNTSSGNCTSTTNAITYGTINQDGDASTVGQSVANGTATCSGTTPTNCNMPGVAYVGNLLSVSFISNGYLYIIGGCPNNTCSSNSALGNTAYVAISSTGIMTKPDTCPSPRTTQGGMWCVDTTNTIATGVAAASPVVFNGMIYLVGGLDGSGNIDGLNRATINQADGSIGSWTNQTLSGLSVNNVSYSYAFARANPSDATNNPGNLYILGGCSTSSNAGCTAYSQNVYKCNIQAAGSIASCSTSGQQLIGTLPGDTSTGLGIMSGTVYANYVYLIGGVSPNLVDLKTVRYAKIDNNNNIVSTVNGTPTGGWVESPYQMAVGRRRSAAFGYNGYLYAVGGYEASTGVLADIEFIKINVSDGSLVSGWTVSAVQINQRWGLTVPVSNSYAYVIGGCTTGASPSNCTVRTDVIQTFQIYNNNSGTPSGYANSANSYATSPNRIGVSATVANGYLYVAGGCTGTTDCVNPTADVSYAAIDANGNIGGWTSTTSLPAARAWGKLLAAGGSLYYVGGQDANGASQSTIYYATPASGTIAASPGWQSATNGLPASRTQFGATVWNNRLYVVAGNTGTANQVIYNTAGTNTLTIPSGVTTATVKAWGAGGGGGAGSGSTGSGGAGGGGGFAQATISVTTGDVLTINVGTGGAKGAAAGNGGAGGGFSGVIKNGGAYSVQAGGGGGGGGTNGAAAGGTGGIGGGASAAAGNGTAGGGTTGGGLGGGGYTSGGTAGTAGTTGTAGYTGATNLGGDAGGSGAACNTAVTTRGTGGTYGGGGKGGNAATCVGGGGGGGGAYGGGGGGSAATTARGGGGGGGGSSIGTTQNAATGTTPGNSTDSAIGTAGVGGSGSTTTANTAGTDGMVSVTYGTYTDTATVYVSPDLSAGGNITSAWSTGSTSLSVARSTPAVVAYANNLYVLGGYDGANYLSDTEYSQLNTANGNAGAWTYTNSLPKPLSGADAVAANGYIYLVGGRSAATSCDSSTLIAPVSANTTISSGNLPTGVGEWSSTNQRYTGSRYGNAAAYNDGKLYVLGGACGTQLTYPSSNTVQQTALLSQPQVAKYSIMIDTDSDVFTNYWLLNGVDNSIGARWQLKYRSMANQQTTTKCATMTTWGQETNFGNVTLGTPGAYTVKDGSGTDIGCGRYFFFNVTVDSSQAFGYPDDVSRGPTITDLTLQFTADPSKRLMHGRTFTGGIQMPDDTPM